MWGANLTPSLASRRVRRLTTTLLVAAALGAGCGDEPGIDIGGNPADRAFVTALVPHHELEIALADEAATRGRHTRLRRLAATIAAAQRIDVARLNGFAAQLRESGVSEGDLGVAVPRRGIARSVRALRTSRPFDRTFIDTITASHETTRRLIDAVVARGNIAPLRRMAEALAGRHSDELAELRALRTRWYGT